MVSHAGSPLNPQPPPPPYPYASVYIQQAIDRHATLFQTKFCWKAWANRKVLGWDLNWDNQRWYISESGRQWVPNRWRHETDGTFFQRFPSIYPHPPPPPPPRLSSRPPPTPQSLSSRPPIPPHPKPIVQIPPLPPPPSKPIVQTPTPPHPISFRPQVLRVCWPRP